MTADTIYALSSGTPPAGIAVVRISGPRADAALERLAGRLPEPRRAVLAALRPGPGGELLDRALILRFRGPHSATGEDVAELHLHGGRAVVAGVLEALSVITGLRAAEPGEFTRRAFDNGRLDLAEAEGLADLLAAETQSQRRAALAMAGGSVSRLIGGWQARVLTLAAALEAVIDFSDEGEVGEGLPPAWAADASALRQEMEAALARPPTERLRDGVRVVIAGPPNAGKSSLLNALVGRDAALISPAPGTTRDVIELPVALGGVPLVLTDTAGLRESDDAVEAMGVERAWDRVETADILLWLGDPEEAPPACEVIRLQSKIDIASPDARVDLQVSARTGEGMADLIATLAKRAASLLPGEGETSLTRRHRAAVDDAAESLADAVAVADLVLSAEALRRAGGSLDRVTGAGRLDDMLDALFSRFCIGK